MSDQGAPASTTAGGPTPEQLTWTEDLLGGPFMAAFGKAALPGISGTAAPPGPVAKPSAGAAAATGAHAPKAAATPKHYHPATVKEKQDETTRTLVKVVAAQALQETYNELSVTIERWASGKKKEIGAMKPHQMPTSGGVLLELVKTVNSMAKVAFPELGALEAVAGGLEVAGTTAKVVDDHRKEGDADSAEEVKEAQSRSTGELDDLIAETHEKVLKSQQAVLQMLEKVLKTTPPDIIESLDEVKNEEYASIRKLLKEKVGISRGNEFDSSATKSIVSGMDKTFRKWVKTAYQQRNLGPLLDKAANAGSFEAKALGEIYTLYTSDDPDRYEKVKEMLEDVKKKSDWPYGEELMKIVHKLNEKYDDVFESE